MANTTSRHYLSSIRSDTLGIPLHRGIRQWYDGDIVTGSEVQKHFSRGASCTGVLNLNNPTKKVL